MTFGPDREHPPGANALVSDLFYKSFFRSKYLWVVKRIVCGR